jgi:undecaprenyl diphosphate synthase
MARLPTLPAAPAQPETAGSDLPAHVAIIMDGNGRWAVRRGLPRVAGHRAGAEAVRRIVKAAAIRGIRWLTLYAFSSENWRRPITEILDLTGLLRHFLRAEVAELQAQGVRIRFIGDRARFDPDIQTEIARAETLTAGNTRLNLIVALSYGGRGEIVAAAQAAARAALAGTLDPEKLDEASFARLLYTDGIPDPDLLIRTSGELRLSNFLLWQCAYTELVFTDLLWPDFTEADFAEAIAAYARRERRYGARPA